MGPPPNQIYVTSFSKDAFAGQVALRCGGEEDDEPNIQTISLGSHLHRLDAGTLVVEEHYIDRHYTEESTAFYANCLLPRRTACSRIHAFDKVFSQDDFDSIVALPEGIERARAERDLDAHYLGFVVVRPLQAVPIGRTVLRAPRPEPGSVMKCTTVHDVYLAGLKLHVAGLAFQQQDQAVGACATTAVWSALQRSCRNEGCRAPSPAAVTRAAVSHGSSVGRYYPSDGLTAEQVCEALREHGFPPEVLDYAWPPEAMKARIGAYLTSGIPVILGLYDPVRRARHAITALGFDQTTSAVPSVSLDGAALRVVTGSFQRVYVHDDRIGPYATGSISEAEVEDPTTHEKYPFLLLTLDAQDHTEEETWVVHQGIAPLYPKLRTSALELIEASADLLPVVKFMIGAEPEVQPFFLRSGDYQRSLAAMPVNCTSIVDFQKKVALSRYVGVTRWSVAGRLLFDVLWDTTDRIREATRIVESILGIVVFDEPLRSSLRVMAEDLKVPIG